MTANPDFESQSEKQIKAHAPVAEKVKRVAVETFGIPERHIKFAPYQTAHRNKNGKLVIRDAKGLVEYELETGIVKATDETEEVFQVSNHNQHQKTDIGRLIERRNCGVSGGF